MKASFTTGLAFAFGIGLLTAGCGGGGAGSASYGGSSDGGTGTMPPPAATKPVFNTFVKEQLAATSNTSDPVDVNGEFEFSDDDEAAFADVL
jgi:hypothetical protein